MWPLLFLRLFIYLLRLGFYYSVTPRYEAKLSKISLLDVKQENDMETYTELENTQQGDGLQQEQEPRTYSQEEVEEIVRKRLARERRRHERETAENSAEKSDREKDLDSRELRLMAKEKLLEAGMPLKLSEVLNYSDEKTLDEALEMIKTLNPEIPKAWGERHNGHVGMKTDPIRKAMGLDRGKG